MEDLASLGFSIDSTPFGESERAMDRMTASAVKVDAATKTMTESQRGLGTATASTTVQTEKQAQHNDALAAAYRRATAQITGDAQARVAAMRSVESASAAMARRESDAYAMARQQAQGYARAATQSIIDASSASSRTLMASVAASTESIKALYIGTAVAANTAAAQITAANARVAASAGASTGYMGRPGQVGLNAQQRVMLGYQLQDVGVSLIGGMNPLVVAAQQGPQISMLYGGVGNMLRAIPKPVLYGGIGAAVAGAGLYGLNAMAESQDERREQDRRFTTLLGSQREAVGAFQDIRKSASETGIAVDIATAAFVSFARATQGLGASRADIQGIATTVEKLTQIAGANDNEADAAGSAVADMLRKSAVGAEDLRKVLTNVPQIADQIAAGLGVSVTQLRLMTQEGMVTNRQVMEALVQRAGAVNEEFARMPKSIGSTFSSLATDLGSVLKGFVDAIPIVNQYRAVLELAAAGARKLREASAPETPQQIIARTSAAGAGAAPVGLGASGQSPGTAAGSRVAQRDYYAAQYDLAAQEIQQWSILVRDAAKAGDELVLSAAAIAEKFSPLNQQTRASSQSIDTMEKALVALQKGATTFSAEEAARQIDILTRSLERAREQAANFDPALRSINDVSRRNEWRANDPSAAGMAYQARVYELSQGDPAREQNAITAALSEQQEKVADIVVLKQQEADASTRMLEAVRKGKAATIEAKVEAAVLAFVWANVGNNVEVSADQIKAYGDSIRTILKNEDMMGGVNAAKQYTDALAGIAAQMKVVEQGAYAMRRAEAEATAARADNGTGALQLQVFDARQALTDATTLDGIRQEIDLTNKLAAAAGDVAKQKGIQLDYDIKRAQLAAGPGARADIERSMRDKAAADKTRDLADGAAAMERQLALTIEQTALVRSGNADYAAQLAMFQKRNELAARGVDIEGDANAQRQIALAGDQARSDVALNQARDAADATKRTWMNAFDNVQTFGADTFYGIFTGATLNGADAATSLKNIFLRTFADIAAAAVIRPLVAPIFQAGQSLGIVPQGVGGAAWGGTPTAANSNGFSMPGTGSMGWFGETFSGIGNWLKSPISGNLPSNQFGPPAPGQSFSSGWLGDISWGQGLGAAAGIGMGAYQLINSKSTAQTIGGIGSMIGGAVSLVPGIGQIAGPLIAIASQLLPSLMGEPDTRTHSSTNANLIYGSGGWYTTGGAWGANANSGQSESALRGLTGGIDSVFDLLGGVKDASKVWGLNASSWTAQGKDWSYTSNATHLVDPNGNREAWRMNMDDMMDTGAAQVAIRSILSGAVGEISTTMKTALEAMRAASMGIKETAESITFVDEVYERLGKGALTVRAQFRELESKFGDMTETAKKLGLALDPLVAEQQKATERLGQDYIDNLIDPVAAGLRAWEDEKQSILANIDYIKQHTDVIVDQARISEALLRKEAALKDQLYNGAISQLEDALARLMPGGNLSNSDPSGMLAGIRASYQSTYAQAAAGDAAAIGRFGAESTAYAEYARSYFAGSAEYEAIRQQIIDALRTVQASVVEPGTASGTSAGAPASNGNDAQFQQLMATVQSLTEELRQERAESAQLRGLLTRYVANGSRAA
jgi:tape measure domain-containing protein